jgi:hypothetical protein
MNEQFTTLKAFSGELKSAFESKDWDKIAALDLKAQFVIAENELHIKNDVDKSAFGALIVELQSFYDQLATANLDRRSELGSELKKLNKEHNAISQYLQSSSY